jgi:hypothetical protein
MFDVLYSNAENKVGVGLPSVGVKSCVRLVYDFFVVCSCCIYVGGCREKTAK